MAQQGNNWYFGITAGLSFNTNPPAVLYDGALRTFEGCSSVSDDNGQLLFYSDGHTVYNRLHQVMLNGTDLNGDISSTNSCIIVPKPSSVTSYYIFTADAYENNFRNGYCYSEVDMSGDNGLGEIINKNILLAANNTERLTATFADNGSDIWVITQKNDDNNFYSYKVDCSGVKTTPVLSRWQGTYAIHVNLFPPRYDAIGCIKVSPDGKRVAVARSGYKMIEIYDFDNKTGILSNMVAFPVSDQSLFLPYGVEFSPDSKLLYVGCEPPSGSNAGALLQYKIDTHDSAVTHDSRFVIRSEEYYYSAAVQLGPDGKIYCVNHGDAVLDVINNPNAYGVGCGYSPRKIVLGDQRYVPRGLPQFFSILHSQIQFSYASLSDCNKVAFTSLTTAQGKLSYLWDFGDGTTSTLASPQHTYTKAGKQFFVKLAVSYTDPCPGTLTAGQNIILSRESPVAGFSFASRCGDFTINFTDTSHYGSAGLNEHVWNFGDGITSTESNPSHTYPTTGTYPVTLSIGKSTSCGGVSTINQSVAIESKPVTSFISSVGCLNEAIRFTNTSSIQTGTIQRWFWDFGDGTLSVEQSPTHTYSEARSYLVKAMVASSSGCLADTLGQPLVVTSVPKAGFIHMGNCTSESVAFTDQSVIEGGIINHYNWDFGDKQQSAQPNPFHKYSTEGDFPVILSVISESGCQSDPVNQLISIQKNPVADFATVTTCGSREANFSVTGGSSSQSLTWQWNFGDSKTGNGEKPSHTYEQYQSYRVKLVAATSLGCLSDTTEKPVDLNPKPVLAFSYSKACVNTAMTFTNQSAIENGTIKNWFWDYGDGHTSNQLSGSNIYLTGGNYTAKLCGMSDRDCPADTLVMPIRIETFPKVSASVTNGCEKQIVPLQNATTNDVGSIAQHVWDFGNGDSSFSALPSYSYPSYGNYQISYYSATSNGCESPRIVMPITIDAIPQVSFSYSSACLGKPAEFVNRSTLAYGTIGDWSWNFDDGSQPIHEESPTHTYTVYRNYITSLTATTTNGCSARQDQTLFIRRTRVYAGPDILASFGQPVQLQASGALSYSWTPTFYLNNPLVNNPVAMVEGDISYTVKGTTTEGCIGYDTVQIKAMKGPDIYVPSAFTPNGDGKNDNLKPILPGIYQLDLFAIYNRWGKLIFSTKKIGDGWNGTDKAMQLATADNTYIWIVKAKDYTGRVLEKNGTVVLIR